MASEATRQKDLIKSGKLAGIGSKSTYSQGEVVFDAVENILLKYGDLFSRGFADELDKADANASGAGTASIRFEYKKNGASYEVNLYMNDYLKFVDQGVQGVDGAKSINKTSPYKFKFRTPSKSHVAALEKWIAEKNVVAVITVPKGIVTDLKPKTLAYIIGKAIKIRGLKATYFKKNTIDKLKADLKKELLAAAGKDMVINIAF